MPEASQAEWFQLGAFLFGKESSKKATAQRASKNAARLTAGKSDGRA